MVGLSVGPFATNCWILPTDMGANDRRGPCILVDPGADAANILALLDEGALVPILIACTHGHLDHTSGIPALVAAFAARHIMVPIAIHALDRDYLGSTGKEKNLSLFKTISADFYFEELWSPLPEADRCFEEGERLASSPWSVIHCPGHSSGSVSFYHEAAGLLVSGDTLFRNGVGRTDGPDSDRRLLYESITKKLFALPSDTKVFTGHGAATTIGREKLQFRDD